MIFSVIKAYLRRFLCLERGLDISFQAHHFSDNRQADMDALFRTRNRKAVIVEGFSPESIHARNPEPGPFAFAHVVV